jgi:hypothetical protein
MFSRWRKIQALGLTRESKDETAPVGKWLHYTFGLTFLPQCVVDDAFVELMEEKPTDSRLDEFCDYLVDYYIDENSNFPPHIWVAPFIVHGEQRMDVRPFIRNLILNVYHRIQT